MPWRAAASEAGLVVLAIDAREAFALRLVARLAHEVREAGRRADDEHRARSDSTRYTCGTARGARNASPAPSSVLQPGRWNEISPFKT
jgi:hypothetical protein